MLRILVLVVLFTVAEAAQAELRGILVEITPAPETTPREVLHYQPGSVNIYSDETSERKRSVSVAEAAEVLKTVHGKGSPVYIDIVFHRAIVPKDLIGILDGIRGNYDLTINYIGRAESKDGKTELERFKHLR